MSSAMVAIKSHLLTATWKKRTSMTVALVMLLRELWKRWKSQPRNVPIHHGHCLLGFLPEFASHVLKFSHFDMIHRLHLIYGATFAAKLPLSPWWVVTTRPENVEHILKTNFENYPKGTVFQNNLEDLLGRGIFNADGKEWHSQRKTASRMFTANLFKEHIWIVVQRNARKLRGIMEAAEPGKSLDVFNLMNRFTLDTIGEIGFGKAIGSLEDPTSPFLKSFDMAQQISFQRFYIPGWQLLRRLGMGSERATSEHMSRLDAYSRSVVRELRENLASGSACSEMEGRNSFVGLFLEDAQKRGEQLSEDYLRDLVLNFLIAGRDTTAQSLSWTIYCLCTHPAVMTKVREELRQVCGIRGPVYEDMNRLPYLQATLSEALRLYPSVPVDLKSAIHDDLLPDGTHVPAGTTVLYNIYGMGRDKDIWGNDADVFRPERWLERSQALDNYAYPVFNAGPRECLGRRLALVEMKACLAVLLPTLSFHLAVPADRISCDAQLTLGMRGLPCIVTRADETKISATSPRSTATESTTSTLQSQKQMV